MFSIAKTPSEEENVTMKVVSGKCSGSRTASSSSSHSFCRAKECGEGLEHGQELQPPSQGL